VKDYPVSILKLDIDSVIRIVLCNNKLAFGEDIELCLSD
jgi:hypothetical protein